ncbi:ankyrin repeat domain-containing protein [Pseudoxanthomonas winnipegensis]|uniref:Ankyrin repeat domain-containing protein n=1 Tax=Pseudoxanthomonas winnipegensis TaxID=2480810 RepID=A0A4Q8M2K2_9GAMM|nr:ankyrin repeat domain-containing protein [Pseudoxanthomonas winnipegensis]TAA41578.1 ankyrin repeat domain-containing protein [Pseudoxanthomonas winnipegensis]
MKSNKTLAKEEALRKELTSEILTIYQARNEFYHEDIGKLIVKHMPKLDCFRDMAINMCVDESIYNYVSARIDVGDYREKGNGNTILMNAVIHANSSLVGKIIANGSNLNHANDDGMTALHYAYRNGAVDYGDPMGCITKLLIAGADQNARHRWTGERPRDFYNPYSSFTIEDIDAVIQAHRISQEINHVPRKQKQRLM